MNYVPAEACRPPRGSYVRARGERGFILASHGIDLSEMQFRIRLDGGAEGWFPLGDIDFAGKSEFIRFRERYEAERDSA